MPDSADAWAALVAAVRAFAAQQWGDEPVAIRLELRHLGAVGRMPLPLACLPAAAVSGPVRTEASGQTDTPDSHAPTEIESAIVAVLQRAERPLPGQAIALRAGRSYSGTFRQTLRRLEARGDVLEEPPGYWWLVSRGQAPPADS